MAKPCRAALAALLSIVPALALAQEAEPVPEPAKAAPAAADRLCLFLPLTGPHGALGTRVAKAVEQAFLPGTDLLLRKGDTQGSADEAAAWVRKAAEEGCALVAGGLGDREALAMADAAEAEGVPFLSLGASPDGTARKAVAWVRTARADPSAELARKLVAAGVKRASGVAAETVYARAAGAAFRSAFEAAGGKVIAWQALAGDGRDAAKALGEAVRAAREAEPCAEEAVFVAADLSRSRRIVAFLGFEGVLGKGDGKCAAPVLVGTPLWNEPAALARSGDALQGARFADVAVARAGDGVAPLEAEAADAGALARTLLKAHPGASREVLVEALGAGVSWTGPTGDLALSGGRVTGRAITVYAVDRGAVAPAM